MEELNHVSDIYGPFNTVNIVEKEVKNNVLKHYAYIGLLIASGLFLVLTLFALFQSHFFTKLHPTLNVKLYLVILAIMILVDLVALFFELKNLIHDNTKKKQPLNRYLSILISIIVGGITFYLFYFHLNNYINKGIKETKLDGALLTFLKILIAFFVFFKAYEKLKPQHGPFLEACVAN